MQQLLDSLSFRSACSRFATGVAIAAVLDEDGIPHGLTINSFTSVSLTPPLVLICIDYNSAVLDYFRRSRCYGISVLREDQEAISNRFAQRGADRFDGVAWRAGECGVPLLDGALAQMECEVVRVIEAGDHAVFLAGVRTACVSAGDPLLYFGSAYRRLGPR